MNYQQAGKGFICFLSLRIIYQGERTLIVPAYYMDFLSRYVENCQPVFYLSLTGFGKKYFLVFLDPFSLNVRLSLVLVMGTHEYYCHCFFEIRNNGGEKRTRMLLAFVYQLGYFEARTSTYI